MTEQGRGDPQAKSYTGWRWGITEKLTMDKDQKEKWKDSLTGRGKTHNKDLRTRACELCSKTSQEARVGEATKANKKREGAGEVSTSHCLPHSQAPLRLSPTYFLGNHGIYHNPPPLGWG